MQISTELIKYMGKWTVKFSVGNQSFVLYNHGNKKSAVWMQVMLNKAFSNITNQQSAKDYLNECIEKATPNLSKIKDVDKELAEIRGEQPITLTDGEEKLFILDLLNLNKSMKIDDLRYYSEDSVCSIIKQVLSLKAQQPEITESLESQIKKLAEFIMNHCEGYPNQSEGAIDCAIRIIKDLKAQQSSDEDIEIWARNAEIIEVPENSHLRDIYIRQGMERGAKAMRDNKIPVSGKDEK